MIDATPKVRSMKPCCLMSRAGSSYERTLLGRSSGQPCEAWSSCECSRRPNLLRGGRTARRERISVNHFLAAPSIVDLRSLERGCSSREGAYRVVLRFLSDSSAFSLSVHPHPTSRAGLCHRKATEAVMDELAQSHYMQLCFGRNLFSHTALHHCCDPTADVS